MAKRLYVGNLPYSVTDQELRDMFTQVGPVDSATVIIDKNYNRSKGFGFVEMTNDEDAAKAIEMYNGKEIGGRGLVVNEARPMEPRAPRTGGSGGFRPRRDDYGGGNRDQY